MKPRKFFSIFLFFSIIFITFFATYNSNFNPVINPSCTNIDTSFSLSPYTSGYCSFNGYNSFLRGQDVKILNINYGTTDSFTLEITIGIGLPRQRMHIMGKYGSTDSG